MIKKFCFTLAVITTASFSMVSAQQTEKVTASGIGYLEYLPDGYHSNSNRYPVVISLHGIKEKGTTSTNPTLVKRDLERVDNVGLPKYVKYGKKYPFILISPQLKSNRGSWPPDYVIEVLNYVKKHLRIDEKRIYLTGLSLGGLGVWRTAAAYPKVFAAIAPVCPGGNALGQAHDIAAQNVAAWGFHGNKDNIVSYTVTTNMINAMNSSPKKPNPLAKATIFPGMGHGIWDKAYNDTNVLNWMLSFRNGSGSSSPSPSNAEPVAKAGSDKTLTLPSNSLYIQGSAADEDGKIVSYRWTKISGGSASLSNTSSPKFRAYNLREGTYQFRLTVKDNNGAVGADDIKVVVKTSSGSDSDNDADNNRPLVHAGPDRILTLPTNSIYVQANASDKDGSVVSYQWTKTYGGNLSLSGANTSRVRIYNMAAGVYIFKVTARDNDGASKDDYFKITVKSSGNNDDVAETKPDDSSNDNNSGPNLLPIVNGGPDRILTLPTNSIYIQGKATDKDGSIVSYQWTKTYGNRASLSGANTSRVRIYNLSGGVYIFRLTAKDNDGAIKHDYFKVTVKARSSTSGDNVSVTNPGNNSGNARPAAHAGPDLKIPASRNSIRLNGSGTDRDGRIVSYRWRKIKGPAITIKNPSSPNATVTNLKRGHYYFSLTVKDNDNATHVDKIAVVIGG